MVQAQIHIACSTRRDNFNFWRGVSNQARRRARQTNSKDLVSTLKRGYVQTKQSTSISTMQKFIYSASWKLVPGGLTSDAKFCANRGRLTMLYVFGKIGRNNQGRKEQKRAKQVGCQIPTDPDNRMILLLPLFCVQKRRIFYFLYSAFGNKFVGV